MSGNLNEMLPEPINEQNEKILEQHLDRRMATVFKRNRQNNWYARFIVNRNRISQC